jgi:hypothetical protein
LFLPLYLWTILAKYDRKRKAGGKAGGKTDQNGAESSVKA